MNLVIEGCFPTVRKVTVQMIISCNWNSRLWLGRQQWVTELGDALSASSVGKLTLDLIFCPHVAREIFVPRPGIEPVSPALGAQSHNHWTTREVLRLSFCLLMMAMLVQFWHCLSKLQMHTLFDTAIPFQGTYSERLNTCRLTYTWGCSLQPCSSKRLEVT